MTITAAIVASDDTDPAPRITLVSIVSNMARAGRDIAGAALGTDDRQFAVQARPGAVYTVTYRATDAAEFDGGDSQFEVRRLKGEVSKEVQPADSIGLAGSAYASLHER